MKGVKDSPRSSKLERPPLERGLGLACGFWFGFKVLLDFLADGRELVHDFGVSETNHPQTEGLEVRRSGGILSEAIRGVVLRTIKFNHKFSRGAIKIWNERSDGSLPQESRLPHSTNPRSAWSALQGVKSALLKLALTELGLRMPHHHYSAYPSTAGIRLDYLVAAGKKLHPRAPPNRRISRVVACGTVAAM